MIDRVRPIAVVRAALLPAACLAVMAYAAFHAIAGTSGVIAWRGYVAEHAAADARAAKVAADKGALARQVALLDPHHVDRDLADELVRRDLGVVRSDEVIIPLPDTK